MSVGEIHIKNKKDKLEFVCFKRIIDMRRGRDAVIVYIIRYILA